MEFQYETWLALQLEINEADCHLSIMRIPNSETQFYKGNDTIFRAARWCEVNATSLRIQKNSVIKNFKKTNQKICG